MRKLLCGMMGLVLCFSLAGQGRGTVGEKARGIRVAAEDPVPVSAEKRVALIIGNGAYTGLGPLRNPVNDARAVAAALKECNFQVQVVLDANRGQMVKAVQEFGKRLPGAAVGLFYFAGHGVQVEGVNYLMPVQPDIQTEDEVPVEALSAQLVLNKMESAKTRLNLIILDACRNNPLRRNARSGARGLSEMKLPSGSLMAFATAPGSIAMDSDKEGRNGLYTKHLLEVMKEPGLPVEQVFKKVLVGVKQESGGRQVPWVSSSLEGDFCFKESGKHSRTPAEMPKTPQAQALNPPRSAAPAIADLDFTQIKVKHQPAPPPYPASARLAKIQGTVVVQLIVDEDGVPIEAVAVEGPPQLRATATEYALQWRFYPAVLDGFPVKARFKLTMPYRLNETRREPAETQK